MLKHYIHHECIEESGYGTTLILSTGLGKFKGQLATYGHGSWIRHIGWGWYICEAHQGDWFIDSFHMGDLLPLFNSGMMVASNRLKGISSVTHSVCGSLASSCDTISHHIFYRGVGVAWGPGAVNRLTDFVALFFFGCWCFRWHPMLAIGWYPWVLPLLAYLIAPGSVPTTLSDVIRRNI